ncbi:Cystatin [Parasponia andersonii]|uniref:Cysteine proteinase inhibitor n=1 Tax=Parasponia andersonii TaxID=3476 RepID=A0A2P5DLC9_PARAD|nr:Cystatin [Parasponia andersonii]
MATLGGIREVEGFQNSVEIENLARFAVEEYNKKENGLLEFVKVVNAKEQVVSGTLYYITLEAVDVGDINKTKVYEAKVLVKPWIGFKELQEFKLIGDDVTPSGSSSDSLAHNAIVGGVGGLEGSQNSLEIENLARFAVDEYNKKENALLEFVKVVNVKQQVVSGTIYYITLVALDGDKKKVYEAKVWEKPWLNFKEVQGFKLIGDATNLSESST